MKSLGRASRVHMAAPGIQAPSLFLFFVPLHMRSVLKVPSCSNSCHPSPSCLPSRLESGGSGSGGAGTEGKSFLFWAFPELNTSVHLSLLEAGHTATPRCRADGIATPNKIRVWLRRKMGRKDISLGIYQALSQMPISKRSWGPEGCGSLHTTMNQISGRGEIFIWSTLDLPTVWASPLSKVHLATGAPTWLTPSSAGIRVCFGHLIHPTVPETWHGKEHQGRMGVGSWRTEWLKLASSSNCRYFFTAFICCVLI